MALFLDTSFVIALEMARDNQHKAAAGYWAGYIQNPQAVAGNVRQATNDLGTLCAEGGRQPARGGATGQRDQPQMAVQAGYGDQAAMRARAIVLLIALALAACGNTPPAPDWQMNAKRSMERAQSAYLEGKPVWKPWRSLGHARR